MKRGFAKVACAFLRRALLVSGWFVVLAWATGRLASDRFVWSQLLLWIPTVVATLCAGLCFGLARMLRGPAGQHRRAADVSNRSTIRKVLSLRWLSAPLAALLAMTAWFSIVDLRLHSLLTYFSAAKPAHVAPIRILSWNTTTARVSDMATLVREQRPNIALLSNTPFNASLVPVRDEMGAPAIAGAEPTPTYVAASVRLNVVTLFPVLHSTTMSLGITGAKERSFTWIGGGMKSIDTGQLMCVELDTTRQIGRTLVLWQVDLPSDPNIPRARMMQEFKHAIDAFASPILRRTDDGLDRVVPEQDRAAVLARLKHPDIIAGDFNTTRGSASLAQLLDSLGTYQHAMEQCEGTHGIGWNFTYPRLTPLYHIDHVFVRSDSTTNDSLSAASLKARHYEVFDPAVARHCVQLVDIDVK